MRTFSLASILFIYMTREYIIKQELLPILMFVFGMLLVAVFMNTKKSKRVKVLKDFTDMKSKK